MAGGADRVLATVYALVYCGWQRGHQERPGALPTRPGTPAWSKTTTEHNHRTRPMSTTTDWSTPKMPELSDLTDLGKLTGEVTTIARDAAYVAVGLGVLGFQRAQVQRVELTNRLNKDLDLDTRISRVKGNVSRSFQQIDGFVESGSSPSRPASAPSRSSCRPPPATWPTRPTRRCARSAARSAAAWSRPPEARNHQIPRTSTPRFRTGLVPETNGPPPPPGGPFVASCRCRRGWRSRHSGAGRAGGRSGCPGHRPAIARPAPGQPPGAPG